ncbi:hypothetical protein BK785_18935 [Bacillus thuringiensis serovar bolivia]|nr:hypothetical protein BK785_18935 [Bacillus thuringiensis serovar bolivia]OUA78332.1 hypothetical protein BK787_08190 [Bacillus thuringiensis serovar pahangi]
MKKNDIQASIHISSETYVESNRNIRSRVYVPSQKQIEFDENFTENSKRDYRNNDQDKFINNN